MGWREERRFRRLYEESYRPLFAYALRRVPAPEYASDVVAETLLIAWRRLDVVPAGSDALPWLYGVARRVLANQERGLRRAERLSQRLLELPRSQGDVESEMALRERYRVLLVAFERLDGLDQEVLRLAAWEGLSAAEMADVLACSENAATLRLHRARARLAEAMSDVSGASEKHARWERG